MSIFKRMGVLLDDTLPDDQKLGYLIGIIHTEINVPVAELDALMDQLDFPKGLRPENPRSVFAFQTAVRNLTQKKTETFTDPGSGLEMRFLVEYFVDILPGDARQLSRKIQYQSTGLNNADIPEDIKKQLAIYVERTQKEPEKMAIFEFVPAVTEKGENDEEVIKEPARITKTNLFQENNLSIAEQTEEKYEELKREYALLTECYTDRYLKRMWQRLLDSVYAIPYMLANGGVYFVPKEGKELADKFITMFQEVHKRDGQGILRILPIIDTEQQRMYIQHDVEKRINEKYEQFLKKTGEQLDTLTSPDDVQKMKERYAERKGEFESELQDTLIRQYSELLHVRINAKFETFVPTSDRLKAAKEFLADLN